MEMRREKARELKGKVEAVIDSLSHSLTLNKEGRDKLCAMMVE